MEGGDNGGEESVEQAMKIQESIENTLPVGIHDWLEVNVESFLRNCVEEDDIGVPKGRAAAPDIHHDFFNSIVPHEVLISSNFHKSCQTKLHQSAFGFRHLGKRIEEGLALLGAVDLNGYFCLVVGGCDTLKFCLEC